MLASLTSSRRFCPYPISARGDGCRLVRLFRVAVCLGATRRRDFVLASHHGNETAYLNDQWALSKLTGDSSPWTQKLPISVSHLAFPAPVRRPPVCQRPSQRSARDRTYRCLGRRRTKLSGLPLVLRGRAPGMPAGTARASGNEHQRCDCFSGGLPLGGTQQEGEFVSDQCANISTAQTWHKRTRPLCVCTRVLCLSVYCRQRRVRYPTTEKEVMDNLIHRLTVSATVCSSPNR